MRKHGRDAEGEKDKRGESERREGKMARRNDSMESRGRWERRKNRWRKAGRRALICGGFNCLDPQ